MEDKRLIRTLDVENFLSYGSGSAPIELRPLNVLIGPNASGKSNLLEALAILRATPTDLMGPVRQGGGIAEWLWKGAGGASVTARIEATLSHPKGFMPLRYRLSFTEVGQRIELVDEVIENERPTTGDYDEPFFFYRFQNGHPVLNIRGTDEEDGGLDGGGEKRFLRREDLSPEQSVLSQRKDPEQYPEVTYVGRQFAEIRLYREWNLGRFTAPRLPQRPDLAGDFLEEDATNLGLVLNLLEHHAGIKKHIVTLFQKFYERVEDITVKIYGGTVQIFVHERRAGPIPATRLSDGTLRYLCLLTVLCHPKPPPLVCIEEPELGLHPDILPTVADLLVEASQRTQLIVTTHSDVLVSALSETPDAVVVCEYDPKAGTVLRRLEPERLGEWLREYSLGDLWLKGELGGTRW